MNSNLDAFDHVVVLMLENRSFDNLLGYLYEPDQVPRGQTFEGVAGKDLSNPIPAYADQADRRVVPVVKGYVMDNPNPDPGEEYPHVNTQLYGTVLPEANRYKQALDMTAPYNTPDPIPFPAPMVGFVTDYIDTFRATQGRDPTYDEYAVIMNCYPPEAVPVLSTLARQFAVCDHWYSAVPSQTFCNRSFFHAASASGCVLNPPYAHWVSDNTAETIFNRIESLNDRGLSWRVYFDPADGFSLTALIHYPRLRDYFDTHFLPLEQFYADVRTGQLPNYAFLQPRLFINRNDMHPPIRILGKTQPSSVLAGELLISEVYEAIRHSDNATGSNYQNTLLVITFDEHGGCYDHVPPPAATPPDPAAPAGQMGFKFDRLGIRVPTVLISAYIEAGTVINTLLDHTSIIKTLSEKWGLGHLTERDKASNDIREAFSRSTPRDRHDWPELTPRSLPHPHVSNLDHSLNDLQKAIVGLALAIGGDPKSSLADKMTVFEAVEFMKRKMASLKK